MNSTFTWKGKTIRTMGETIDAINELESPFEGARFIAAYTNHMMVENGWPEEEARKAVMDNLSFSGIYMSPVERARLLTNTGVKGMS